jgi:hypothetical protein
MDISRWNSGIGMNSFGKDAEELPSYSEQNFRVRKTSPN